MKNRLLTVVLAWLVPLAAHAFTDFGLSSIKANQAIKATIEVGDDGTWSKAVAVDSATGVVTLRVTGDAQVALAVCPDSNQGTCQDHATITGPGESSVNGVGGLKIRIRVIDAGTGGVANLVGSVNAARQGGGATGGPYAGSASEGGPATTALALSADGTNCPAGAAARGVDEQGNAEECFTPPGGGPVGGVLDGVTEIRDGVDSDPWETFDASADTLCWDLDQDGTCETTVYATGGPDAARRVDSSTTAADFAADFRPFLEGTDLDYDYVARGDLGTFDVTDLHIVDFDDTAGGTANGDQEQGNVACLMPFYPGTFGTSGNADGFPIVDGTNVNQSGDRRRTKIDLGGVTGTFDCSVAKPAGITAAGFCGGMSYIGGPSGGVIFGGVELILPKFETTGTCHSSWGPTTDGNLPYASGADLVANGGAFIPYFFSGLRRAQVAPVPPVGMRATADDDFVIGVFAHRPWGTALDLSRVFSGWVGAWFPQGSYGGAPLIAPYWTGASKGAGFVTGNPRSGAQGGAVQFYYHDGDDNLPDGSTDGPATLASGGGVNGLAFVSGADEGNSMGNGVLSAGGEIAAWGIDMECADAAKLHNLTVGAGFCAGTTSGLADGNPCAVDADCKTFAGGAASGTCTAPSNLKAFKIDWHAVGMGGCDDDLRSTDNSYAPVAFGPGALEGKFIARGAWGSAQNGSATTRDMIQAHPNATIEAAIGDVIVSGGSDAAVDAFRFGDYWNITSHSEFRATFHGGDSSLSTLPLCVNAAAAYSVSELGPGNRNCSVDIPSTAANREVILQDVLRVDRGNASSQDCVITPEWLQDMAPSADRTSLGSDAEFTITSYTNLATSRIYIGSREVQTPNDNALGLTISEGPGGDTCSALLADFEYRFFNVTTGD